MGFQNLGKSVMKVTSARVLYVLYSRLSKAIRSSYDCLTTLNVFLSRLMFSTRLKATIRIKMILRRYSTFFQSLSSTSNQNFNYFGNVGVERYIFYCVSYTISFLIIIKMSNMVTCRSVTTFAFAVLDFR